MPFPRPPIDYGASDCIVNSASNVGQACFLSLRYSCVRTMMQRREASPPEAARMVTGGGETRTPHERYSEAMALLRKAESRVRVLADRFSSLGQHLSENPLTVAPIHEAAGESLPLHITTHPFRKDVDMAGWPDEASIIEALGELHRARSRALALRAWMLPEDRDAAPAP